MSHRLALALDAFDTLVVALGSPGAVEFDRESGLGVARVGREAGSGGARAAVFNTRALARGLRFRPDVTLSMHIVASPAAAAISRSVGSRTVQYFHAEEITARPRLAAFAAREARAVIAVSAYTSGLVKATGAVPLSMRVIPPGVEIAADRPVALAMRPTFVTIARLNERYKGHDVMVRALALVLAKMPDAHWIVIGEGQLRPGIERLARSYGVAESISFLGAVSDAERDAWLRRSHLMAMPSRLPAPGFAGEGFGIAYLEAAAHGKPVVAGGVGGATAAVADGESGLLVDPTDPVEVAEAITRLLRDPELARRLGAGGLRRARDFTWPLVAARVQEVLLEQCTPPSRSSRPDGRSHESARTVA